MIAALGVTPCVGVWIETLIKGSLEFNDQSHPAWVCGLKPILRPTGHTGIVTPCVGVWIETHQDRLMSGMRSHTLRGCVD